jgi:hypothetical protein
MLTRAFTRNGAAKSIHRVTESTARYSVTKERLFTEFCSISTTDNQQDTFELGDSSIILLPWSRLMRSPCCLFLKSPYYVLNAWTNCYAKAPVAISTTCFIRPSHQQWPITKCYICVSYGQLGLEWRALCSFPLTEWSALVNTDFHIINTTVNAPSK